MEYYPIDKNDFCLDCSVDTLIIGEYYMVHDDVWFQTGLKKLDGMLCITCLEKRIGRQLTSNDFSNFPINKDPLFRSELLTSRLHHGH